MSTVRYFATKNLHSPFVAVIGDWPGRSALKKSLRSGVFLFARPAIQVEVELERASTRHVFLYWGSLRDLLWTHRSPDLIEFYEGLVEGIRKQIFSVRKVAKAHGKKRFQKERERAEDALVSAQNKLRKTMGGMDGSF